MSRHYEKIKLVHESLVSAGRALERSVEYVDHEGLREYVESILERVKEAISRFNPREFNKNEEVMVYDGSRYYAAIIEAELEMEEDDDTMPVFPIGEDGKCSLPPVYVKAGDVYQKAPGKTCPKCGKPLYIEHNEDIDYPYFCPDCDEIFYAFEV